MQTDPVLPSSAAALRAMRCRPREGEAALSTAAIDAQRAALPDWSVVGGAIEKVFAFDDFHRTIGFVNALAWICNAEDHHPTLSVTYGRCVVRFDTHSVGGLSMNDFICAAKADALLAVDA